MSCGKGNTWILVIVKTLGRVGNKCLKIILSVSPSI